MSVGRPVALRDVKIALQKPNEELLIVRGAPGTGSHYFSETWLAEGCGTRGQGQRSHGPGFHPSGYAEPPGRDPRAGNPFAKGNSFYLAARLLLS